VNRAQQRFEPETTRRVTVQGLFFAVRVQAKDAFFGTRAGSAVVLRYPDGHSARLPLGADGAVLLGGLPRGAYLLRVRGSGVSFARPLVLSRSQDVTLQVITWFDLELGATVVLLGLVGLELARRGLIHRARRRSLVVGGARRHA
jgi:hypothetical protein